jgi:hypothetical protein
MADERGNLVPVQTEVVLQTLVEHMFTVVEERRTDEPPSAAVARVLEAPDLEVADGGDPSLDSGLRHAGYLTRVVEAELFEPAQRPADWIPDMLRERFSSTGSWSEAIAEVSAELARAEPVEKPSPNDESAKSWRIPGPGGHVRHFVARRAIEAHLSEGESYYSVGDPAELKRPWVYGFFVRACEEALPPEAELDAKG